MISRLGLGVIVIGTSLLSASCGRSPATFAMPAQKSLNLGKNPGGLGPFVTMDDPSADDHLVRDIGDVREPHRWAFAHPEMRFRVDGAGYTKFAVEFAIVGATFKDTGPVTVSVAVDGRNLGSFRCDHPGDYRMEKPVPPGILTPDREIHVAFEASPKWVSPDDGAQLSFYLRSAGFVR